MTENLLIDIDDRGVATVTMNRPAVHNAFNDALIAALHDAADRLERDERVRVILLRGAGKSFSAGADLDWMKAAASYTEQENHADAQKLSEMLHRLNTCPRPVVALVQGAAMGGGAGLVACADIAIAVRGAVFAFSEVRLGLTPATISPYVLAKIGESAARRFFITGTKFDAEAAERIGLIHQTVGSEDDLEAAGAQMIDSLLKAAPGAQAAAKDLVHLIKGRAIDAALRDETAARIAARRTSDEGREGVAAFLEGRTPRWIKEE